MTTPTFNAEPLHRHHTVSDDKAENAGHLPQAFLGYALTGTGTGGGRHTSARLWREPPPHPVRRRWH